MSAFVAGLMAGPARAQETADPASVDLSPWSMFLTADPFVKGVMIVLVVASALTWTIALAKGLEIAFAARKLARQIRRAEASASLETMIAALRGEGGLEHAAGAAHAEIEAWAVLAGRGAKARIAARLDRLEAGAARRFRRATGILATIAAASPFVGLFGTVWGVMNSFIGISKHHATNLAVIAPGLAEALLTTALGLAAAIPAVVVYNVLARAIAGARGRYADGVEIVMRAAGRQIDATAE